MTSVIPLRVTVEDVWNEVLLELPPATSVGDIKRKALALTRVKRDPSEYVLKYRGAFEDEVRDLALPVEDLPYTHPRTVINR